jgi:hypothetical protein
MTTNDWEAAFSNKDLGELLDAEEALRRARHAAKRRIHPESGPPIVPSIYEMEVEAIAQIASDAGHADKPEPPVAAPSLGVTGKRTRVINDIGIGFVGVGNERMHDIRVYAEGGSVLIWAEVEGSWVLDGTAEGLQYLTPSEAMAFSRAFRRCAIAALEAAGE